jgi:parallel beta helix pectate lyase-like protein
MRTFIMLVVLAVLPATGLAQKTWYVPNDFPTIQGAISSTSVGTGDTIIVRSGTYVESINFRGKAITVKSERGPAVTFIDANKKGRVVVCSSHETKNTVLDGFTIKNGRADSGAGMWIASSSPTVLNCIFTGNLASLYGGGMYTYKCSSAVTNCTFDGNHSYLHGGGIWTSSSSAAFSACTFAMNHATNNGGGMCNKGSKTLLQDCTFTDNRCYFYSGGGMCDMESSDTTLTNCTFSGNMAKRYGGGLLEHTGRLTMTNCTVCGNSAELGGGGLEYQGSLGGAVWNCVFWGNGPEPISRGTILRVGYSCVQYGFSGSGNIKADPLFVDASRNYPHGHANDLHLTALSPCRDKGTNSAPNLQKIDFEGDPRVAPTTVDMGADEFFPHLYHTGEATPGKTIQIKMIGQPGMAVTWSVSLVPQVLEPPATIPGLTGSFYLNWPFMLIPLGVIPKNGLMQLPLAFPTNFPVPSSYPTQALIGLHLSNLNVVDVK